MPPAYLFLFARLRRNLQSALPELQQWFLKLLSCHAFYWLLIFKNSAYCSGVEIRRAMARVINRRSSSTPQMMKRKMNRSAISVLLCRLGFVENKAVTFFTVFPRLAKFTFFRL